VVDGLVHAETVEEDKVVHGWTEFENLVGVSVGVLKEVRRFVEQCADLFPFFRADQPL
jgi:hypothetical protein